jgi:serine/threonine protein kinase
MQMTKVGDVIAGRFELKREIGKGRMSRVFEAVDLGSELQKLAIKLLDTNHADNIKRELFKRDTQALNRLNHPNIVRLVQSGFDDSHQSFYLALSFVPHTLVDITSSDFPRADLRPDPHATIYSIAEALAHAHSQGVIHRDIKPANVLVDDAGQIYLTDFGISRLVDQLTVGETLAAYWSGGYASPEQIRSEPASMSSDIFSLGALYFEMLAGSPLPPEGPTAESVDGSINNVHQHVKRVLKKMLDPEPNSRFQTANELLRALEPTRQVQKLPQYFLQLTHKAQAELDQTGLTLGASFDEKSELLIEDLGGQEADEIHLKREPGSDKWILIGDTLKLVCVVAETGDHLVVISVINSYLPRLDSDREWSMPHRGLWQPVTGEFRPEERPESLVSAKADLKSLETLLVTFENQDQANVKERQSRRSFVENWETTLKKERARIERSAPLLQYSAVHKNDSILTFDLNDPAPDDLVWGEDAPIAVATSENGSRFYVGSLIEAAGNQVRVSEPDLAQFRSSDFHLPDNGFVTLEITQASVGNRGGRSFQINFVSAAKYKLYSGLDVTG